MEYKKLDETRWLLRLDPDDEIIASLGKLAAEEGIRLAMVQGLGAVKKVVMGVYNVPKQAYKSVTVTTPGGGLESVEGENYSALPIVPLWGSDLHQSTLVGLKAYIDNTDLVMSGFCNDLHDFSEIYWLCENFNGMTDDELQEFLVS